MRSPWVSVETQELTSEESKMMKLLMTSAAAFTLAVPPALAQVSGLTVSVGVDYVEGEFNTNNNDNWTWTIPFTVKYETGPWILKASIPYVRTHGVNRDVGQAIQPIGAVPLSETQDGLGDTVLSGFYTVADARKYPVGVDLGVKVKLVTASKEKDLITTGNEDYSFQADLYQVYGLYTVFGTIGWTKKGDIRFRDRDRTLADGTPNPTFGLFLTQDAKDPWYLSIGGSYKLSQETSVGLAYDFREKVLDGGSEISEATLFLSHRFTKEWKVQPYGLVGFSDGSPDWGLGATVSYGF